MAANLMTAKEVAERLQVKSDRVRGWIRSGQLRGIDLSSNPGTGKPRFRVSQSDLEQFLTNRKVLVQEKPQRRGKQSNPDVIDFFPMN